MLGAALGSHPAQMDGIPHACLCFTLWGSGVWAQLCCSGSSKVSALRSSKVCSYHEIHLDHRHKIFLLWTPFLLHCMENLSLKGSACFCAGFPKIPPARKNRRSLSCFLFCTEFIHKNFSRLTLSWCASSSAKVGLADSWIFPLDPPAYHSPELSSAIFWL